jgi:parallel beta-helix repeat protein
MRSLPLFIGLLIILNIVMVIPMTVMAPPKVDSVVASTDRTDYIIGMVVNTTATVGYGGQITGLPSTEIWFEWYYPNGTMFLNESMNFVDPEADHNGTAYSTWTSNYTGPSGLPFWVNVSYPFDPAIKDQTQFYLYYPDERLIVTELTIDLGETTFEIDSVVTATVTLTAYGNESMLEDVTFYWNRSDSSTIKTETKTPDSVTFIVTSSWLTTEQGTDFTMNAIYPVNDTISEIYLFNVAARRVKNWQNNTISSNTFWQQSDCPYGVHGMVTIDTGAVLTINPGCVVKFNYSSGFIVKGTLIAQGTDTTPVTFTSYQFTKSRGDWNWVEFTDGQGSVMSRMVIEYAGTAIKANSGSPLIENNVIRNIGERGVSLYDSQAQVLNNTISNASEGIYIENSNPVVENNTIEDSYTAIRIENSADVSISNITALRSNHGMNITSSSNITVESSTFNGSSIRGLKANIATDVTFFNSTFESNVMDVLLIASEVWLVSTSFSESRVEITTGSKLVAANFLHLRTELADGTSVPDIAARIETDGTIVITGNTDSEGYLRWLVVADRTFDGTNVSVKNVNVVNISSQAYNVASNDRTVDMATSRTEVFILTSKSSTNGGILSGEAWFLILILVAVIAALLIAFLVLFKRRKKKDEEEAAPKVPALVPVEEINLKTGTMYLMDEEKPSRTYELLKKELAGGTSGLCITRTNPEKARERHDIDCSFLWLSRNEHEDSVKPTNLGAVLQRSKDFLNEAEDGIIVLDGLEYLIIQNGFTQALRFIHLFSEAVSTSNSKVVISFNLRSLDKGKRALLTSDLEVLR